jgi:hypothetical protein
MVIVSDGIGLKKIVEYQVKLSGNSYQQEQTVEL